MLTITTTTDWTLRKSTIVRPNFKKEASRPSRLAAIELWNRPPRPPSKASLKDIPNFFPSRKSTIVRSLVRRAQRSLVGLASRLAPDLLARWSERRLLRTRRHDQPSWELELLGSAEPFTFRSSGMILDGWRWGGGRGEDVPVVILAHGWGGRGGQMAAFAGPLVRAGFDVVAFDAPGHGRSPGKSSSFPEIRAAIEDVARTVRDRGWGRPYGVVAHSAGTVSTAWAVRRGIGVERLVLVAPPTDPVEWTGREGRAAGLGQNIVDGLWSRLEKRFDMHRDELRSLANAPTMRQSALVVHDRGDRVVPFAEGWELASAWPGAQLLATEGLGHQRILRDPTVVEAAVEFLRS